jgi:DNA-binding NarL/FixJ family response regulator
MLVEDQVLLREGLAGLFRDAGHDVIGSLGDAAGLTGLVAEHNPDVVLLDIRLPPTYTDEGTRAAAEIKAAYPATGVLLLSQHVQTAHTVDLVAQGGFGYLLKDRVLDGAQFTDAVARVAKGGTAMDPEVIARLLARTTAAEGPTGRLSPREREVLGLMAEGRSNAAIATRLVVTERAIAKHTASIFAKLDLQPSDDDNRRVLAVLAYLGR